MARAKPKELVALASFAAEADGVERLVRVGDVIPANDPVLRGRELLFEPAQ